jgi:hypothetical protein
MATRVLNFSRAHPDPSQGPVAALSRLEAILARSEQVARHVILSEAKNPSGQQLEDPSLRSG